MDQHLLSRVLIKQFVDDHGQLRLYDLRQQRSVVRSYGRAGRGGTFTSHDPRTIEAIWASGAENFARQAFSAVRNGTIFEHPDLVQTLKRLIALHYFRTRRNRQTWDTAVQARTARAMGRLVERFGSELPPDEMGLTFEEQAAAGLEEQFQEFQAEWFQRAGTDLHTAGLEIFDTTGGLLLSDAGALLLDGTGKLFDGPFLDAATIALPIGRNLLAAIGPANARFALGAEATMSLNSRLMEASVLHAYSHPEDDLTSLWP